MIAGLYQRIASWILSYLGSLKGHATLQRVHSKPSLEEDLTAYSVSGYEIRIFCKLEHNRRKYDKWFIPTEDVISYRLYGVVSPDAPTALREVCEFDVCVPYQRQRFIWSSSISRSEAIKEYLDVLITRLENLQLGSLS
jgi:hypothetical protein